MHNNKMQFFVGEEKKGCNFPCTGQKICTYTWESGAKKMGMCQHHEM